MTPMPGWERSPAFVFDAARCTLSVLDQAHLPFEQRYLQPASVADCARVIRDMNVRGAPLIGLAAACRHGLRRACRRERRRARAAAALLIASRPTAVNLRWAVQDLQAVLRAAPPAARAERPPRACWPRSVPRYALLRAHRRARSDAPARARGHAAGARARRARTC